MHEGPRTLGFGAELAARIQEELFYDLEAPVLRATGFDTPYPPARLGEAVAAGRRPIAGLRREGDEPAMTDTAVRDFLVPDLGEGLEDATITEWQVAVGDEVELNQVLCTVETNKAEVELPSPYAGRIVELGGDEGQTLAGGSGIGAHRDRGRPPVRAGRAGGLWHRRRDGRLQAAAATVGRARSRRSASSRPTSTSTWRP